MSGRLGAAADPERGGTEFRVWAPRREKVDVLLPGTRPRTVRLEPEGRGYHAGFVEGVGAGARYCFRLDEGLERPDPASRFQPEGVHGPSEVVAPFGPRDDDDFAGRPLSDLVIYELHVGTFTSEGDFAAVVPQLDRLRDLGITALELMPVAQFPGTRNWGYDAVQPFAVQNSYGGPLGLRRLVQECHARGLAVILDVIYNHIGPEGNYLGDFGPYFTPLYHTPWGDALNFDGPDSDEVRRYFIENTLMWIDDFHIDALRLDAVHAILDRAPVTFLEELAVRVQEKALARGRSILLIAESDANDPRLVRARGRGGVGLDAVWADDLHHALHVALTEEDHGYYRDYDRFPLLAEAYRTGFAYQGQYSAYRRRRHGAPPTDLRPEQFVVCSQNHDQIGNRLRGDRLTEIAGPDAQRVAAALVLLSPHTPLLFMGEEYGETRPFLYFTSHGDADLGRQVREGRTREFAAFGWSETPPDPQSTETFRRSILDREGLGTSLESWYRALLTLRRELLPVLKSSGIRTDADEPSRTLTVWAGHQGDEVGLLFNFSADPQDVRFPVREGTWSRRLDSAGFPDAGVSHERYLPAETPTLTRPAQSVAVYSRRPN